MSKFTIKVKLQGLEIEVDGSKEDAPVIAKNIGARVGALLQPSNLLESSNGQETVEIVLPAPDRSDVKTARRKSARRSVPPGGSPVPGEELNLVHDPGKWGTPQQGWTTAQKAIWLLYVVENTQDTKQLSAAGVSKTFNKHFRAAKPIRPQNVTRDLEKEKLKGPEAPVSSLEEGGTTKYFLTQKGQKVGEGLAKAMPTAD